MLQHRHAEIIFFLFRLTFCFLLFIFQPLIQAMFSLFLHFFFATFYEIDFAPIPPKKLFHSKAYRRTPTSIINDWIYFVNWNFLSAACSIECFIDDMSNMRKTIANLFNNFDWYFCLLVNRKPSHFRYFIYAFRNKRFLWNFSTQELSIPRLLKENIQIKPYNYKYFSTNDSPFNNSLKNKIVWRRMVPRIQNPVKDLRWSIL